MSPETHKRLVVVHNPNSTGAARAVDEVIKPLYDNSVDFTLFETQHSDTEANIADMRKVFQRGDRAIVTGGDGTKMQAMNAVCREQLTDIQFGLLPYGNYNDLADKHLDIHQIINQRYTTSPLSPMTIDVNGEYYRHAPSYLTLGFTALAASRFSSEDTREIIKRLPLHLRKLANIAELAISYLQMSREKLPTFHTSESDIVRSAVTDILLLNSKRAGGIIRSHPNYAQEDFFGYHEANVTNIFASLPFGLSALAGHAIADPRRETRITFERPSTVPLQSEGEFMELHDVSEIFVYKNPKDVLTIMGAGRKR